MPTEQVQAPKPLIVSRVESPIFTFDPIADLLGAGTVGEVFKVTLEETVSQSDEPSHFALKRFFNRADRDDYQNELSILQALAPFPQTHIVPLLVSWTSEEASYMLFPIANGDLYHFLRSAASPKPSKKSAIWLLEQSKGLCEAIAYLHHSEEKNIDANGESRTVRKIGFHHDLKPANILLFGSDSLYSTWKIADFGSGTIKEVSSTSRDSIYNRKASTGDPVYSAPEYVVEEKVSRPKDIWSLGCIFLESLIWALDPSKDAIECFEQARMEFSKDAPDQAPTFWCEGGDGLPGLNCAVETNMKRVEVLCKEIGFLGDFLGTIRQMLTLEPKLRPVAAELCDRFKEMLQDLLESES